MSWENSLRDKGPSQPQRRRSSSTKPGTPSRMPRRKSSQHSPVQPPKWNASTNAKSVLETQPKVSRPQETVAPPTAALASVTGRLRELASLRASGALTEAQFERAKNTELGLQ